MLGFYRAVLSPMMPSSCRYLPTCSNYSIDAYKTYGVWKGSVLTAWRLMRCNPWGGRGYDPPSWPPKGIEMLFQAEYSPQVAVVLGAMLAAYLVNEMWRALFEF